MTTRTRVYLLAKGLSHREALRRARKLDGYRDYRGFTYNPWTGRAAIT